MTVTDEQFGERIRVARERFHLTQQELGEFVDLSTAEIDALERGTQDFGTGALMRIAYALGRNLREFFEDSFADSGALSALFRADVEIRDRHRLTRALQEGMAHALQFTSLEAMLGIRREALLPTAAGLADPGNCDEAVQQGEHIAATERLRLRLGEQSIDRIQHLLETQGVGSMAAPLPESVSGVMLFEARIGAFVLFNSAQPLTRRRFSIAHEYGHVLMDRHRLGCLSRIDARDDLIERRADAFAAAFLMPADGVRRIAARRSHARQPAMAIDREILQPSTVGMLHVAAVAQAFGVSRRSALRRLRNLQLVSMEEFEALRSEEARGVGQPYSTLLGLFNPPEADSRRESRGRLLGLACEAYRLEKISRGKLNEIGQLAGFERGAITRMVEALGME